MTPQGGESAARLDCRRLNVRAPRAENASAARVDAPCEQAAVPVSDRTVEVARGVDVDPVRWTGLPARREAGRLDGCAGCRGVRGRRWDLDIRYRSPRLGPGSAARRSLSPVLADAPPEVGGETNGTSTLADC